MEALGRWRGGRHRGSAAHMPTGRVENAAAVLRVLCNRENEPAQLDTPYHPRRRVRFAACCSAGAVSRSYFSKISLFYRVFALWKGAGAIVAGVGPARAIHFFAYARGKQLLESWNVNGTQKHLLAAAAAGVLSVTSACLLNPRVPLSFRHVFVPDAAVA